MAVLSFSEITDQEMPEVAVLWESAGLTRPWNDPKKDMLFALKQPNSTILVGRLDSKIATSVMVGHDGHRGTVYYLSVDPKLHTKGLGRQTMEAAENWLINKGVWKLNLMMRSENTKVQAFYEAIGYSEEDRTVMSKKLIAD